MELDPNLYTVAWIAPLEIEARAALYMLDNRHHGRFPWIHGYNYLFHAGDINGHNVVIATLPSGEAYGTSSAAALASQIVTFFPNIRFGLLVGVAAGLPNLSRVPPRDIRLGDVLVGLPEGESAGLVAYDLGKETKDGFQPLRYGHVLATTETIVRAAIGSIKIESPNDRDMFLPFYESIKDKEHADGTFVDPGQDRDNLHEVDQGGMDRLVAREQRPTSKRVRVWYGPIGSGDKLMKDAEKRNELRNKYDLIGLEVEAAGTMNQIPVGVIRGVCDYGDEHKAKEWQPYAAAMAAAYAKAVLYQILPRSGTTQSPSTLPDSAGKFHIPLDLSDVPAIESFLGRHEELERLWNYLQPGSSKSRKVAIVDGLGGMGKTQLGIRFARDHKDDFTAIFWLSGKTRETLLQALCSVLPRLSGNNTQNIKATDKEGMEKHARKVLQWLATPGNSDWLLIFDNIDQYSSVRDGPGDEYDIAEFFPVADQGSILITSRLQSLTEVGMSFPIQKLEPTDAIELFLQSSRLSIPNAERNNMNQDMKTLTGRFDGLPLAIVIAGAYMRETGTSIREYLHYYEKSWHILQSHSRPQRQYDNGNMLQTWLVTYLEIKKRNANAAKLLLLLAHFDNRDIWYALVKRGSTHSSNSPAWLDNITSDHLVFKESMRTLIRFSLIEVNQHEGSYMMHPVVQNWCLHVADTEHDVKASRLTDLAVICVGFMVGTVHEQDYWKRFQRLLAHADFVLQRWKSDEITHDIAVWGAFNRLGDLYYERNNLEKAEEMYRRALAGREKALGPEHPSTLSNISSLGIVYRRQGRLKEAEIMYHQALTGHEKVLGPDHIDTLSSIHGLGHLYSDQGKLKEAEEMYRRALAGRKKVLGPDHASTLSTTYTLGSVYHRQGRLKEAEKVYQQAVTGYEKALGPEHTHTLFSILRLGNVYLEQKMLNEAEEMYSRALAGCEKVLSPNNILTYDSVFCLGMLYQSQGRLMEAEKMFERALVGYKRVLGPDHYKTQEAVEGLQNIQGELEPSNILL